MNQKDIKLKKTFRALLLAEAMANAEREAAGKAPIPFAPNTLQNISYYLYAIVVTANPDLTMSYDDFVELMDDKEFEARSNKWFRDSMEQEAMTSSGKKKAKSK